MYNPLHWFWAIDGSTTQVWSSEAFAYTPVSDAGYQAWLAAGNVPTKISAGDMAEIQADIAIDHGVAVSSASTPALDGTYAIGPSSQAALTSVAAYIILKGCFPSGSSTQPWADAAGHIHVFPNVDVFKAFATAIADYVATVAVYGDSRGAVGSLPTPSISII